MTQRTFTTKSGTSFEWEETPETIEALEELHKTVNEKKFAGNYPGPLYAPHPAIQDKKKSE